MRLIDADGLECVEDMLPDAPTIDVERNRKAVYVNGDYSEAVCSKGGGRIETAYGDTGSKIVFNAAEKTLHYCVQTAAQKKWR